MNFGVINKLRKIKGLTSAQLAALSGVPIGTLNKILRGETKNPKLETLKALARVLECKLDDFDSMDYDSDSGKDTLSGLQPDELVLIQKYRHLPEGIKEDVMNYIEIKYANAKRAN